MDGVLPGAPLPPSEPCNSPRARWTYIAPLFQGLRARNIVCAASLSIRDLFEGTDPSNTSQARLQPNVPKFSEHWRSRSSATASITASRGSCAQKSALSERPSRSDGIELAPIRRPVWEGSYGGRERDPAWPAIFEWAVHIASVQLLGAPVAFDTVLLPPKAVLIAADELAAAAMHSLEREARSHPETVA